MGSGWTTWEFESVVVVPRQPHRFRQTSWEPDGKSNQTQSLTPFSICKALSSIENGHGTTGRRIRVKACFAEGTRVQGLWNVFLQLKSSDQVQQAQISPKSSSAQVQFGPSPVRPKSSKPSSAQAQFGPVRPRLLLKAAK